MGAEGACHTAAGTCEGSSTGRESDKSEDETSAEQASTLTAAAPTEERTGAASATGQCAATTGGCDLSTRVRVDGEATADAEAGCAEGATGCEGKAATATDAGQTSTPAVPPPPRERDAGDRRAGRLLGHRRSLRRAVRLRRRER